MYFLAKLLKLFYELQCCIIFSLISFNILGLNIGGRGGFKLS